MLPEADVDVRSAEKYTGTAGITSTAAENKTRNIKYLFITIPLCFIALLFWRTRKLISIKAISLSLMKIHFRVFGAIVFDMA
jgi:hypothetical protein